LEETNLYYHHTFAFVVEFFSLLKDQPLQKFSLSLKLFNTENNI